jgi:RNA polymerase primary sigma factor
VTPEDEEMLEEEGPESPPLDLTDAAVLGLLHSAKKRGYVTNDQNALLSSAEVKSEQIEDILAKFSEMGVHVVETERELEVEVAAHEEPEEESEGGNELVEV